MSDRILDVLTQSFSHQQLRAIRSAVHGTEPLELLTGAARSGKTLASLVWWLLYVERAPLTGELPMIGRTRQSVARNVFGPAGFGNVEVFGPLTRDVQYTPGAPTARIFDRTIPIFGAADSRAWQTVLGMTGAGGYVDELTVMDKAAFNQFLFRMSVAGSRVIATTNPDGQYHWVKTDIIDRRQETGTRVRQFTPDDNPHPDIQEWVAKMVRQFPPGTMWHSRYILGLWVSAEGVIYSMFDKDRHVRKPVDMPTMTAWIADGIDYGASEEGNTRGIRVAIGPHPSGDGHALYVTGEWAPPRQADIQLSKGYRDWSAQFPGTPRFKYLDTNAGSLRMQMHADGVRGLADPDKSVAPGIQTIASLLAADRLFIVSTATSLLEEFTAYRWDPKATARGKDEPLKANDHSLDALRYAIYSSRHLWRRFINLTIPEPDPEDVLLAA